MSDMIIPLGLLGLGIYVIMNINNARKLLDYNSEVTSVEISIKNYDDIEKIQKQISTIAGSDFNVKNRQEQNSVLYKTLKSEKLWTFIILVFILIIATFNVIGSISARTGVPPACMIAFTVEQNVIGVVITSSPCLIPAAIKLKCKAAVHEFNAIAY